LPAPAQGFLVADAFGRRAPDHTLVNVVVIRTSDPRAETVSLTVDRNHVDSAPVRDGWAVLVAPTAGLSFLSNVGITASVSASDSGGAVVATSPVPIPEQRGAYC
jgi:hypothetical protein